MMGGDINSRKGNILRKDEVLELLKLSSGNISGKKRKENNIVKLNNDSYYFLNEHSVDEDAQLIKLIEKMYLCGNYLSDYLEEEKLDNGRFEKIFAEIEENWHEEIEIEDSEDECLIVYVASPGSYAMGWSKSYSKQILIDWRERKEDENYSFSEGDIIQYTPTLDSRTVQLTAKHWSNVKIDLPVEPLQIFYSEDDDDIIEKKYELFKRQKIGFIENHNLKGKIDQNDSYKSYENKEIPEKGMYGIEDFIEISKLFFNSVVKTSTHAFLQGKISKKFPELNIITDLNPKELTWNQKMKIRNALARISNKIILEDISNRPRWLVFADEQIMKNGKFAYMYTVISPKVNFDKMIPTSPDFHSSNEKKFGGEIVKISKYISNEDKISNLSFEYPTDSKNNPENTRDAIFTTLQLVLEIIRSKADSEYYVQVLAEKVSASHILPGNSQPFDGIIKSAKDLNDRKKFNEIRPWVMLDKNPVEHPLMGYADLIGRYLDNHPKSILDPKYSVKRYSESYQLFEVLRDATNDALNPELFFNRLITCNDKNIIDYFKENEILGESIDTAIRLLLSRNEQQKLFDIIKNNSENHISQNIIEALMRRFTEILIKEPSLMMRKQDTTGKFEFYVGVLSHAIKTDSVQIMTSAQELLKIIGKDPMVKTERLEKLENLSLVAKQNMFSFDVDISTPISDDTRYSHEEFNFLGTSATSLLLSGVEENIAKGKEIEDFLFRRTMRSDDSYQRRLTNKIEIEIMEDPQNALCLIREYDLLDQENISEISGYLLASCLKCISMVDYELLYGEERNLKEYAQEFINNKCLNLAPYFPDNRVAYWFLKAHFKLFNEVGFLEQGQEKVEQCSDFLLELQGNDQWRHNCKGIMVSCQLLDLAYHHGDYLENYRNKVNEFKSHLESVINSERTADTSKTWILKNYPDEEDWLRPLNYNYR